MISRSLRGPTIVSAHSNTLLRSTHSVSNELLKPLSLGLLLPELLDLPSYSASFGEMESGVLGGAILSGFSFFVAFSQFE